VCPLKSNADAKDYRQRISRWSPAFRKTLIRVAAEIRSAEKSADFFRQILPKVQPAERASQAPQPSG
jgi:hypothetical protein